MIVYGIPNCDTVKKTLDWLKANHITYQFHNFKTEGISAEKLQEWGAKAGYQKVINTKSTTYKALSTEMQAGLTSAKPALKTIQENTSLIKRPVIEDEGFLFFGFDEQAYKAHFLSGK